MGEEQSGAFIETIDLSAPQTTIETTNTSKPILYENGRALLSANMFYWADTGVSTQDVNALIYEIGVIKAVYDSPYHSTFSIGSRIRISPDGENIFTSAGRVFRSSSVEDI